MDEAVEGVGEVAVCCEIFAFFCADIQTFSPFSMAEVIVTILEHALHAFETPRAAPDFSRFQHGLTQP